MNYAAVCRSLGGIVLLIAAGMFLCLVFGWIEGFAGIAERSHSAGMTWGSIAALSGAVILWFAGRNGPREILRKEAVAIVGLGWIAAGFFGALPFWLGGHGLGPAAAWFESVSGFTTTGSTVIVDLHAVPRDLLLWRGMTQWMGGAGILVLFVALLQQSGVGSRSLFRHESSAREEESHLAHARGTAATLWSIYLGLSVVCFLGLWILSGDYFAALTHAFTAVATGGFSPYNGSAAEFGSPAIEWWIMVFMALGGLSFMLMALVLARKWGRVREEEEGRVYLIILGTATAVVALSVWLARDDLAAADAIRGAAFQVISIMTTTGYVTENYDQWPTLARVILLMLMILGGCAGSTAGGIKVGRLILLLKIARQEIIRTFRPAQVFALRLNGRRISPGMVPQTLFFIALNTLLIGAGTAIVALLEPQFGMVDCLGAVVATLFNIGPGFGSVGAVQNFAHLGDATLMFLSVLMLLGRLELFVVLALLVPALWRR